MEHFWARLSIAENKIEQMQTVIAGRKKRASGKRVILKDHLVYTKPEVLRALKAAEYVTKGKKKKQCRKTSKKCNLVSCEAESIEEDPDNCSSDDSGEDGSEILSEIEVEMS